jgi:hypothetical protein
VIDWTFQLPRYCFSISPTCVGWTLLTNIGTIILQHCKAISGKGPQSGLVLLKMPFRSSLRWCSFGVLFAGIFWNVARISKWVGGTWLLQVAPQPDAGAGLLFAQRVHLVPRRCNRHRLVNLLQGAVALHTGGQTCCTFCLGECAPWTSHELVPARLSSHRASRRCPSPLHHMRPPNLPILRRLWK